MTDLPPVVPPSGRRRWPSVAEAAKWSGPTLRLASYGWGYAAQFALTLALGVNHFAAYVAATALGMMAAYTSMAGVSDLLARQWSWLSSSRERLVSALVRLVAPRLILAFAAPALLAALLEHNGLIETFDQAAFWLVVGTFGILSVLIDLCGVMLACLGRPSFHIIVSNGLLGTSFFIAVGLSFANPGFRPDLVLFHVGSQVAALMIVIAYLVPALKATLAANATSSAPSRAPLGLQMGVMVTAVHILEIARAHLPVLLIQASFQSTIAAALVSSLRFSRAADVMSTLAIAQYTKAIIHEPREGVRTFHAKAQRLCLALTLAATLPIAAVIIVLCQREGLPVAITASIAGLVILSCVLRQITAIEIWIAKVVADPAPALGIGLAIECIRFATFFAIVAANGGVFLAVAALVMCDGALLLAMLRLGRNARSDG